MSRPTPTRPAVIVFYVSGHGFGHASRMIEVVNAVAERAPSAELVVRTSAARWLFDVTLKAPVECHHVTCDVGALQTDSLHVDISRTMREAGRFHAGMDEAAEKEAAFLRGRHATMVVADIPPLAFLAAHKAGIPSVGLGNFTWDWIYAGYEEAGGAEPSLVSGIRRAYALASLGLRLPMWGGFEGWTCPIVELPFVARHSRRTAAEVRTWLGVPEGNRMALASFGGLGVSGVNLHALASLAGYTVVTTGHALESRGGIPPGVVVLDDRDVYASGWRYEDLVRAADVVVTKPGYGIIAESLANDAAVLYTSRGHFVEYDVLVEAMPSFLRCLFVGHDDLLAGRWQRYLDQVLALPTPPDRPATNGADVAARLLLEFLEHGSRAVRRQAP